MRDRRVPLVLQGSEVECGAACLAMIATFYGHHLSLLEARELCPTGRDGASAGTVARAARGIGLNVKAFRSAPGIVSAVPLPAIAHWGSDHFVVVERVRGTRRPRVDIVDPGRGRRAVHSAEFDREVGKVVMTARPGAGFARRAPSAPPFWRRYAAEMLKMPGARLPVAQLLGVSAVIQLLGLALPALIWLIIERVIPSRAAPVLPLLGGGILVVVAAQLITAYLRAALIIYVQGRLDTQAMISFCGHLLRLPLSYFHRRSSGDIMLRIGCIGMIRELMTAQTLTAVLDVLMIAVYLAAMFIVSVPVALIVLAAVAAQAALLAVSIPMARDRLSAELAAQAKAYGHMTESIEGISTLKASAAETRTLDQWSVLFVDWLRSAMRRSHLFALVETTSAGLRTLTPLAVLWAGTVLVLHGHMSLGTALATTWLASAIVLPLSMLAANGQRVQQAGTHLHRLADVLDSPPEQRPAPRAISPRSGSQQLRLVGAVELRQVSFRYDPYSPAVLTDVSVTIRPGARVAVVGVSGAGKTTLAQLILGLYQPASGRVLLDGADIAQLDRRIARSQIGTVLQEAFVFSGTIGDNIAFRDPAVAPADIERAARLAGLHNEIAALPQGYQTRLSERGGGLSGGQRQRLAIARALVRQPALLVLDEATSHLDAIAESAIHRNLATLACTQIVIAHRLSTIRDADDILVLSGGRLVEQGSHANLLTHGGHYAALVSAQLNGHDTEAVGDLAQAGSAAAEISDSGSTIERR